MQIYNSKKNIAWTLLVLLMVAGMSWGGVINAAEHEEAEETTVLTAELTEEEKQVKLAQIGEQLEEVKLELIRLSLAVTKLALEEQALALREQLAKAQAETVPEGEIGIAISEQVQPDPPAGQPDPPADEAGASVEGGPVFEGEDVFSVISLENQEEISTESALNQDEDEERKGGFLAALGPFRNLGTPERAALSILFILGLFILVRRFRTRKPRASENVPMKVPENQPESSPQTQGSVFQ